MRLSEKYGERGIPELGKSAMSTHRHAVVWTVNHVYAAIVVSVIAAKSQPNL